MAYCVALMINWDDPSFWAVDDAALSAPSPQSSQPHRRRFEMESLSLNCAQSWTLGEFPRPGPGADVRQHNRMSF
jgi:hypothetical protein